MPDYLRGERTYRIAVAGFAPGEFQAHLQLYLPPGNDDFADRYLMTSSSWSFSGSTILATLEPGESLPELPGFHSVWWTWTAPAAGAAELRLEVGQNGVYGAIYVGDALGTLTPVGELEEHTRRVLIDVVQGGRYEIAMNSFSEIDQFDLALDFIPAPANDHFADRFLIEGDSVITNGSIIGASLEAGEPIYPSALGGHSVWWTWVAPDDGNAYFRIASAPFPPLLALYTGDRFSNLTRVAYNKYGVDARVSTGETFHLALDGDLGRAGMYELSLDLLPVPPNDDFADRIALTGSVVTATGFNMEASREFGEPNHGPYSWYGGRSVWWSWTPPVSGPAVIEVASERGHALMLAVYTGETLGGLIAVTNNSVPFYTNRIILPATAGQAYQMAVDSFNGGQTGDLTLRVEGTSAPFLDVRHCLFLPDGTFQVRVSGQEGQGFILQASGDMITWTNLTTQTLTSAGYDYLDPDAAHHRRRYYRAVPVP